MLFSTLSLPSSSLHLPHPLSDILFLSLYPADLKQTSPHIKIESTQGFFFQLKGSLPLGSGSEFSKASSDNY